MEINIVKITVLKRKNHMDQILIHTDLPSGCPKVSDQLETLEMRVELDTGVEYVKKNFNRTPEIIEF